MSVPSGISNVAVKTGSSEAAMKILGTNPRPQIASAKRATVIAIETVLFLTAAVSSARYHE